MASDRPLTREWGTAEGRPLVFWPGLNPFGDLYLVEIGPLLAEQGVHVVSIAPPWDLPAPDDDLPSRLAQYVLETVPFERFVFMGFSWGGSIGVQLAADHPERLDGLVLLDAGYADIELGAPLDDVIRYRAGMVERDGKIVPSSSPRAAAWAPRGCRHREADGDARSAAPADPPASGPRRRGNDPERGGPPARRGPRRRGGPARGNRAARARMARTAARNEFRPGCGRPGHGAGSPRVSVTRRAATCPGQPRRPAWSGCAHSGRPVLATNL